MLNCHNSDDCIDTLFDLSGVKPESENCIGLKKGVDADETKARKAMKACRDLVEKANANQLRPKGEMSEKELKQKIIELEKEFRNEIAAILGPDIMAKIDEPGPKNGKWRGNFDVLCNMVFYSPQICTADPFFMTALFHPDLYKEKALKIKFDGFGYANLVTGDPDTYDAEIPYMVLNLEMDSTHLQDVKLVSEQGIVVDSKGNILDADTIQHSTDGITIQGNLRHPIKLSDCKVLDKRKVLNFENTMVYALKYSPAPKVQAGLAANAYSTATSNANASASVNASATNNNNNDNAIKPTSLDF